MSSRYLYGDPTPVMAPILTAQAAKVGDLAGLNAGNTVRAEDESWVAAPGAPAAPTVAASAATRGTALTNALTGVKVSANYPWGEGDVSAAGTATPTAAFGLKVTLAALPTYATSWNVYVETAAGSGTYLLQQVVPVSAGVVYVDGYGTGAAPGGSAPTATQMTQYGFAQRFLGVSAQNKTAAVATVAGNAAANVIRIDPEGFYEFDCASATFLVGDPVGPAKDTGNALLSQTVAGVAHESLSVGRVVEAGTSVTKVKVKVTSAKNPAGRKA